MPLAEGRGRGVYPVSQPVSERKGVEPCGFAAIHARFEKRIEEGLEKIARSCVKKKQKVAEIERRVGRLLGQNSRATGLFEVRVTEGEGGEARLAWTKKEGWSGRR